MKNIYSKIGKLLGEWRRKNGFSLYKIAKEGPGNVRYDSLKRVEQGDVVSSETLLCYIDFCYQHGFRVFEEMYNDISLQQYIVAENEHMSETKEEAIDSEFDPSRQDDEYMSAEHNFDNGGKMSEQDQIAFIRHQRCPRCGSNLIEKQGKYGPYIGCVKFQDKESKCEYTASGTFESFVLSKRFKDGVTPTT